jgi:hypothetical protein
MSTHPAQTYHKQDKQKTDYESLRNKLKLKQFEARQHFAKNFPEAHKYLQKKGLDVAKLRAHSSKILSVGALTGSLLLSAPSGVSKLPAPSELVDKIKLQGGVLSIEGMQKTLLDNLSQVLPKKPKPLDGNQEKYLEQLFSNLLGIKAKANLEGEHLNTTYGYIGAEQHLRRYPGDTISNHGQGQVLKEGMAPGLGAWGYFAPSKQALTPSLEETEKWYAVVQTLYLPDWSSRQPYLRDWYKYRKVLIVNTQNGNAVVASIADSGPAAWTGKQFGGSPEVMEYLGGARYKKGAVIVFFVDDPENKVPLGPVDYNKLSLPKPTLVKT